MSRPPIYGNSNSPRGTNYIPAKTYHYFDLDFTQLNQLTIDHAFKAFNVTVPDKRRGLLKTLAEVPALFAHILGEHQNLYFRESNLTTAEMADSLFREARKLAYLPDMGVSASGHLVFTVKDGLSGTIQKDFAIKSSPDGDKKAQIYETLEEAFVDAQFNQFQDIDAMVPTNRQISNNLLTLPLSSRHSLDKGDIVYLETGNVAGNPEFAGVFLVEDPMKDQTAHAIRLRYVGATAQSQATLDFQYSHRALCSPKVTKNLFGWNASSGQFPSEEIQLIKQYAATTGSAGSVQYGYDVEGYSNSNSYGTELFVDGKIESKHKGEVFVLQKSDKSEAFVIDNIVDRSVSFIRGQSLLLPVQNSTTSQTSPNLGVMGPVSAQTGIAQGLPAALGAYQVVAFNVGTTQTQTQTLVPNYSVQLVENRFDNRVSAVRLRNPLTNSLKNWAPENSPVPIGGSLIGGWKKELNISKLEPNTAPFNIECTVNVALGGLKNGRKIFLLNSDSGEHKGAKISSIIQNAVDDKQWDITIDLEGSALSTDWTKGNTFILGNILKITHGESKSETLGDSDGVTSFQTFQLGKTPLSRIASRDGASPILDIRVEDVLWNREIDFFGALPENKIYKTQSNPDQSIDVIFGNALRGAIPQSGSRNISANYKIGLGKIGNAKAGHLTRQVKTSPIISGINNPLPIDGGVDPAKPDTIKQQATRPIKTFGRAVSIQDHADLAMLFPGVATATARWLSRGNIEIVASNEDGTAIGNKEALLAFLNARRDPHIPLQIFDPQPVEIVLSIRIEFDPAYFADTVRRNVQNALIGNELTPDGFFSFGRRQLSAPQSLSGVYAFLSEIEGVKASLISVFDLAPGNQRKDILHATDRQWLKLKNQNLSIEIAETGHLFSNDTGGGNV